MSRPKYYVYIATSIDGYIAKKDGDVSWLEFVNVPNEDYGYHDFYNKIDAIVLGRHSYEKALTYESWPYLGKKVIVLSNTLKKTSPEVEVFSSNLDELNDKLKRDGCRHIYVDGGVTISRVINAGYIDYITISIVPILLGSGIRLFSGLLSELKCNLISSESFSTGLVQLQYEIIRNEGGVL